MKMDHLLSWRGLPAMPSAGRVEIPIVNNRSHDDASRGHLVISSNELAEASQPKQADCAGVICNIQISNYNPKIMSR